MTHRFIVVETNLTNIHGWSLLQVLPRSINNINVVHLISCHVQDNIITIYLFLPIYVEGNWAISVWLLNKKFESYIRMNRLALNGISFDKLNTIFKKSFRNVINCLTLTHPQINMGRWHFVHMKPEVEKTLYDKLYKVINNKSVIYICSVSPRITHFPHFILILNILNKDDFIFLTNKKTLLSSFYSVSCRLRMC